MNTRTFFFLPALIFLCVFIILPFGSLILTSFYSADMGIRGEFIGLENYRYLLTDTSFLHTVANSFLATLATPVIILLALVSALLLRRQTVQNKFFRVLYFLPVVAPIVISGIVWRWVFNEETGLLNFLLTSIGLGKAQWLSGYPTNFIAVLIITVWRGFGYYMMTFLAGLALLPKELEEAAIIDGAGTFRRVFFIIIPQLKSTILFIYVVSAGAAIKLFTELYVLVPGAPMKHKTMVAYMYKEAFERFDFGIGAAAGVLLFVVSIGLTIINIKMMDGKWNT